MTSHWNLSCVVGKEFVEIIFPNFHQIFLSTPPVRSGRGRDVSQIPRGGDIIRTLYLLFNNEEDDDYFDDEEANNDGMKELSICLSNNNDNDLLFTIHLSTKLIYVMNCGYSVKKKKTLKRTQCVRQHSVL